MYSLLRGCWWGAVVVVVKAQRFATVDVQLTWRMKLSNGSIYTYDFYFWL